MKIKKILILMLALMSIFILTACSSENNNDTDIRTNDSSQDTRPSDSSQQEELISSDNTSIATDVPTTTSEQNDIKLFEANKDLKVIVAFMYDNDTYVVVENVGEQAILSYHIAYINFDKNGLVTIGNSVGYKKGKADTANIMPGNKDLAGWYGANGDYVVATIIGVNYADGTSWEANKTQIDYWAKTASKEFSVDAYKENLVNLKAQGTLAETNEYAVLTDVYLKHDNQFSSKYDFHFSIENKSKQGILSLQLFVLEFDENGFQVSVSPYDTYCINGHTTGGTINLAAGNSSSYFDSLFSQSNTTQVKTIISYLEFQDGAEWNNPYLYEWIIGNCGTY